MNRTAKAVCLLLVLCTALMPVLAGPTKTTTAKAPAKAPVNPAFDSGVALYNRKDYRAAAVQFEAAMKTSPSSPDVIYYCALCNQLSNNRSRAKQLFEYISNNFPTSRVAPMAQTALGQLNTLSSASPGSSAASVSSSASNVAASLSNRRGGESDLANVPDVVKIPFEKRGNDIIVQVKVNGKQESFILDTGAQTIAIGANHLRDWGISASEGRDSYEIGGVGDGKAKGWNQPLDIRLGPIYRKDFVCSIHDNMPGEPLLGQDFLKSFNINVDDSTRSVVLAKKGSLGARDISHRSYYGVEIPFKRLPSGHMMVDIKINNKPFPIMFDTGCERTSFAASDWTKLGFSIPDSAQKGKAIGVLGETTAYYFETESIKLGPIEQSPAPVSVTEGSRVSLLGMSFYGTKKYTIDTTRSVIIFDEK